MIVVQVQRAAIGSNRCRPSPCTLANNAVGTVILVMIIPLQFIFTDIIFSLYVNILRQVQTIVKLFSKESYYFHEFIFYSLNLNSNKLTFI